MSSHSPAVVRRLVPVVAAVLALGGAVTAAAASRGVVVSPPGSVVAPGPAPPGPAPSAAFAAGAASGRTTEGRQVDPTRPRTAAAPGPRGPRVRRWAWPLSPRPDVVRRFTAPASQWGAGHRGLDLRGPRGSPVLAVAAGVVTHAGVLAGRGTVTVEHADGLRSTYEPVVVDVRVGDRVVAGSRLGRLAPGGHCGAVACLHLGALREGYLDPLPLLVGGRVRLLPLGEVGSLRR